MNKSLFDDAAKSAESLPPSKWLRSISVMLLVMCCYPVVALAQPHGREGFFEKNFAANPLDSSSSRTKKPSVSSSPGKSTVEVKENAHAKRDQRRGGPSNEDEAVVEETQASIKDVEGTPRRIKSVGAVFNCHDRPHCKAQLEALIDLQKSHSFLLSTIYLIGDIAVDYIPLSPSTEPETLIKNIEVMQAVKFRHEPPAHLAVTKSPSWLIETDNDLFVLEGVARPERYFTAKGEFIDPRQK